MQRREFIGGVAALAATRWENEDYDIENWDPMEGGSYTTGSFTPTSMRTSGDGTVAGWLLEADDLVQMTVEVFYDTSGVHLTIEGNGDDVYGGAQSEFDPHEAKEAAAALYQAAEEYQRRTEEADAE